MALITTAIYYLTANYLTAWNTVRPIDLTKDWLMGVQATPCPLIGLQETKPE